MASGLSWNNLPSVILLEIFEKLSVNERINASSTCKEWRKALFFSTFWRDLKFQIFRSNHTVYRSSLERSKFLTQHFWSCARNLKIYCGYDARYLKEESKILWAFATNRQLKSFILYTYGEHRSYNGELFEESIIRFLDNVAKLETFCLSQYWFRVNLGQLMASLERHSPVLKCLQLKTFCKNRNPLNFNQLSELRILKLGSELITDDIIIKLCDQKHLRRLVIQFEREDTILDVSAETWLQFHQTKPNCELRINMLEITDVGLMTSLNESMPVTHIKLMYSSATLSTMSHLCGLQLLRSLHCIDRGMDVGSVPLQNPLVLCAWSCKHFEELIMSGYQIDYEDLIGIAKLRGSLLKRLDIPCDDIIKLFNRSNGNEWKKRNLNSSELARFKANMSKALNRPWSPTESSARLEEMGYSPEHRFVKTMDLLAQDLEL